MGCLLGIAMREKKRAPMVLLDFASISIPSGIESDFRGKPGDRQVTVLSDRGWNAACKELGEPLAWQMRRANLFVQDIDLFQSAGKILKIADAELLITRETDPCARMEAQKSGLFAALAKEWRGGVCCRVIKNGTVKLGDKVEIYAKKT